MPTDEQRLLVSLEAKIDKFEKAMAKAAGTANAKTRQIEQRFMKMNAGVSAGFSRLGAGFGAAFAANELGQFSDAAKRIDNALKIAGLSGDNLAAVYERLKASAMANGAPIETLAQLYSRAAQAQKELGVTSQELETFIDNVAVALRLSGQPAEQSRGAIIQLTQAIGAGVVRGEEFNSMLEGALPIAQAAAAGLQEAGGSVAKLRVLVIDGKVSSQAFFRAIEAGAPMIKARLGDAQLTIAQTSENMKTAMIGAVGQFDKATGASQGLTNALSGLGTSIEETGDYFERNAPRIQKFEQAIGDMFAKIEDWKNSFRESVGLTVIDDFLEGTSLIEGKIGFASEQVKQRAAEISKALDDLHKKAGERGALQNALAGDPAGGMAAAARAAASAGAQNVPPALNPVSLKSFPVQGKAKGAVGANSAKPFENELENIKERTALLNAERDARARLNPLAVDYDEQVQIAITKQRLLNAAHEQGLKITPEVEASINNMALGYAKATTEADKLEASQRKIQERAEEMSRLERDVMAGFISDLREGTSAAEMLSNALNKIADRLIDMAFDDIFAKPSAGGSGGISGIISGLFKGFSSGGYTGNAGRNQPAGVVHGQEFVMNASATKANRGLLEAMNAGAMPKLSAPSAALGGAGNGGVNVGGISVTINAPNSDAAAVQQLGQQLPRIIENKILDMQSRGKLRGGR